MNRRGFLGTLFATATGLALDPKFLLWKPAPLKVLPALEPEAITGLNAMTRYLAHYLSDRWSGRIVDGELIGQAGLTDQFCVELTNYPAELQANGLDAKRYLDPIGAALLNRLRDGQMVKFGQLKIDLRGYSTSRWTNRNTGISLRGVSQYDVVEDRERVRFDVLCGVA